MPALYDGQKVLTDSRDKAELLAQKYAAVSRLEATERAAMRGLRQQKAPRPDEAHRCRGGSACAP
eukprot:gene5148-4507_t